MQLLHLTQRPCAQPCPPPSAQSFTRSCDFKDLQARIRSHARASTNNGSAGTIPVTKTLKEDPLQRRLRESQRVDERVTPIYNLEDFHDELKKAGKKLVVLEVESVDVCQTGFEEEAEIHYKVDQQAALEPCGQIKHVFQRTARDCPDIEFLAMEADTEEGQAACDALGIEVIPTVQFWREGEKLWEHRGIVQLQDNLGEGVLYYGDSAANNVKASTFVTEITTRNELDAFLQKQGERELTVLDVSLTSATPCVHIFPAVLALAKNFAGYASFGRLVADATPEATAIAEELNVIQVPTFIFFRNGKEVGRHVGSSRGDLIGQILQQQNALGIAPPPAPAAAGRPRRTPP